MDITSTSELKGDPVMEPQRVSLYWPFQKVFFYVWTKRGMLYLKLSESCSLLLCEQSTEREHGDKLSHCRYRVLFHLLFDY